MFEMKKLLPILFFIMMVVPAGISSRALAADAKAAYVGPAVCRECHEKFHTLWSTSWHGKAARPYSSGLAQNELAPQKEDIAIGRSRYRFESGRVIEIGPEGTKQYPVKLVIGGKVTYNFVTIMPDGSYHELPLGYDREKKEWFDAVSENVYWKSSDSSHIDWKRKTSGLYTACPNCHVSQYSPGYEISTATYSITWNQPGVNCETCHGPAADHIKIARETPKGQPLPQLGLLRPKTMTAEQRNDMCNICHAHIIPLTASFKPGDRFFDHFDLATLELDAFYPDGRGKGETFTKTGWLLNTCSKKAKLDCMHCHTSSGRYRFNEPEKANDVCLPCHADRVKDAAAHTHHKAGSAGSKCISCHMSPTYYARMKQSDHSMLPPTPSATLAFGSPNACNDCHKDKDASWADKKVRSWYADDYQAPILRRARLVADAKKGDFRNLPEMLKYIESKDRNEVFAASLIRLMAMRRDERITPVLLSALKDSSPLVRSAAARAINMRPSTVMRSALLDAANDDYRVVRIGAVDWLGTYPLQTMGFEDVKGLETGVEDLLGFERLHPESVSSYEISGNLHRIGGSFKQVESDYLNALRIEPDSLRVMLSLSALYRMQGQFDQAIEILERAIKANPNSVSVKFSLKELKGLQGDNHL